MAVLLLELSQNQMIKTRKEMIMTTEEEESCKKLLEIIKTTEKLDFESSEEDLEYWSELSEMFSLALA